MAIIPPRFNPNQPIPNNPFYAPLTNILQGSTGPFIVGSGLTVDQATGTISATGGGGGGGVTSLTAGAGITLTPNPITTTGTVSLSTVGTAGTVAYPVSLTVNAYGQISAYTAGAAPLTTLVGTSPVNVTGGGSSRTISLATSGVTAGSYTNASFTVNAEGLVTAASSGAAPVTSVTATAPIASSGGATPAISLNDSGVTAGAYTNASVTVTAKGLVTAISSGAAPVTSVTATAPLASSGGATPDLSLTNSGVTAGSYTYSAITVDALGRVTAASNGAAPNTTVSAPITNTGTATAPIIGIQDATTGQKGAVQVGTNIDVTAGTISVASASTTAAGVVQLNDTVASTSTTEALTAAQGKVLQDQITGLTTAGGLTLAGTFDASTSQMLTTTSSGSGAGFAVGSNIPAAAAGNTDFFVIVTTGGSYTPPGGSTPFSISQGDWLLSSGTAWQYLNVGPELPIASTGTAGIVELATTAETQTGTDTTLAVTPAGAAATYIALTALTAKGALVSASAADTPSTLTVGTDGQLLSVDTTAASGLKWINAPATGVTNVATGTGLSGGPITSTGTIALADTAVTPASYTYASITVDQQGRLTAASSGAAPVVASTFTTKGQVLAATGNAAYEALNAGTDGQVLVACAGCSSGLTWTTPAATGVTNVATGTGLTGGPITSTGTIALADTAVTPASYTYASITVDQQGRLTAASSGDAPVKVCNYDAKGDLLVGCAADAFALLAVGSNGQLLMADSACASGLKWASPTGPAATSTTAGMILGCTTSNVVALGCNAGTASGNVFVGVSAGCTSTGNSNVGIGESALGCATASNNIAIGVSAMGLATNSASNIAIGSVALRSITADGENVAIGRFALQSRTGGYWNTVVGHSSASGAGTYTLCNTYVGAHSGKNAGSSNIMIGTCAGPNANGLHDGSILIGLNAGTGYISCGCQLVVGNNSGANGAGIGFKNVIIGHNMVGAYNNLALIGQGGGACAYFPLSSAFGWTFASDRRVKADITALPVNAEEFINDLRPVTYKSVNRETKEVLEEKHLNVGFIAQEVEEAMEAHGLGEITSLVTKPVDENDYYGLTDASFTPFLVKAIQELSAKVAALEAKLAK